MTTRFSALLLLTVIAIPSSAWGQACDCESSWAFRRSTYSHAPETGGRVAQFQRIEPVEGLDDPRQYTSGYRRTRTTLRGADGSVDATYQVQNWGNGRGGLDAEWERFHDAWLQSAISGGSYYSTPSYGYGYRGNGPGQGYPGQGHPGQGYPGQGYPAPYGYPGPYGPGHGAPGPGPYAPHGPYAPGWQPHGPHHGAPYGP